MTASMLKFHSHYNIKISQQFNGNKAFRPIPIWQDPLPNPVPMPQPNAISPNFRRSRCHARYEGVKEQGVQVERINFLPGSM